ncbi:MAG: hypothetical protein ISS71_02260, partial [Phycisphaerae bacterium]|nr:hypothetical protein [Phycisphaerae bacterium]
KQLAKEYQTRIELRQIGSRDEARLTSDFETCGQQCCCSRYLKILEPVNMRMAKLQKATLDPSKISGHCGRLKCCLRYEDQTYMELKDKLPRKNTMVQTPKGPGKVVDIHILTQLVVVQNELGDRKAWPVDELCSLGGKATSDRGNSSNQAEVMPDEVIIESGDYVVDSAAVTAELEEMAQMEQVMFSSEENQTGDDNHRSPRPQPNQSENESVSSNQKDGLRPSGDDKKRRGGKRNRRRKSKNKNRNDNRQDNNNQKNDTKPKTQSDGKQTP